MSLNNSRQDVREEDTANTWTGQRFLWLCQGGRVGEGGAVSILPYCSPSCKQSSLRGLAPLPLRRQLWLSGCVCACACTCVCVHVCVCVSLPRQILMIHLAPLKRHSLGSSSSTSDVGLRKILSEPHSSLTFYNNDNKVDPYQVQRGLSTGYCVQDFAEGRMGSTEFCCFGRRWGSASQGLSGLTWNNPVTEIIWWWCPGFCSQTVTC